MAGAAAGFAAFALIGWTYHRLRGREGLGLGDAKLLAAAGAWVSWTGLPGVVLTAAVTALVVAFARAAIEVPIGREPLPLLTGARGYFSLSGRRVFTIRAEAHTESGAAFMREAVVRLTRDPEQPFRFLAWRQGRSTMIAEDDETQ